MLAAAAACALMPLCQTGDPPLLPSARDKSEKPFGMAFARLMNGDGTTLKDGRHELIVYKVAVPPTPVPPMGSYDLLKPPCMLAVCQADTKKAEEARVYLGLPATWLEVEAAEKQAGKPFHHSGAVPVTKDSFQIATLTCSTKLTQNGATSSHRSAAWQLLSCDANPPSLLCRSAFSGPPGAAQLEVPPQRPGADPAEADGGGGRRNRQSEREASRGFANGDGG